MKTYSLNQQAWSEVSEDSKFPGEWVKRTDAEAEIEKARKEGRALYRTPMTYESEDGIRADERERIAKAVEAWYVYRRILGTPYKESILEVIRGDLLPPVGIKLAGGTKIGNTIVLPNGGTWERVQ